MHYRLSQHARDEMLRRQIPGTLVDQVLKSPQQVIPEQHGRKCFQSKMDFGNGKIFLLRAIIVDNVDPAVVVTVYKTSRIDKYWR